jgi:hypothetical protein
MQICIKNTKNGKTAKIKKKRKSVTEKNWIRYQFFCHTLWTIVKYEYMRVYPKVSGLSLNEINNRWEATQVITAAKLTRLTHKIAIKLHLVAQSCIICSSCSRRPVRKPLEYSLKHLNLERLRGWEILHKQRAEADENFTCRQGRPHCLQLGYEFVNYELDDRRFDSREEQGFPFSTASRPALGHTSPPIQLVPRTFSPRVNQKERETDHSPPSSAEVKNAWSCTSTQPYVFIAWCLIKHNIRLHDVIISEAQGYSYFTLLYLCRQKNTSASGYLTLEFLCRFCFSRLWVSKCSSFLTSQVYEFAWV